MRYTFQELDVLCYKSNKEIKPGDVVIINIPGYKHKIIHRVISAGEQGFRTMGDFNPRPDSWLLKPSQIIGYVVYGYRGSKRFKVHGGLRGLIQMFNVRLKYLIIKTIYPFFNMIFCNFMFHLKLHFIQPQFIAFKRPNGTELQLIILGKVIGRQLPGQKWQIIVPFKFF